MPRSAAEPVPGFSVPPDAPVGLVDGVEEGRLHTRHVEGYQREGGEAGLARDAVVVVQAVLVALRYWLTLYSTSASCM